MLLRWYIDLVINSIFINNFGKLKDFEINFHHKLNVIYGENEYGKTTLMNFIKMMFYGCNSKSNDINKNMRKKYTPWDGSTMSGIINFNHNNTEYRLEREFYNSNTSDKISLWNITKGEIEDIPSKVELGQLFFNLSSNTFDKIIYMDFYSSNISNMDKTNELSQKLMNLSLSGDESISQQKVIKRLKESKEYIKSKSGKNGVYDKLKSKLSDLTEELAKAKLIEEQKQNDYSQYENTIKKIKATEENLIKLKELSDYYEKQNEFLTIKNIINNDSNIISIENKLNELYDQISNEKFVINKAFMDKCTDMLSQINLLKKLKEERIQELQSYEREFKINHKDEFSIHNEDEGILDELEINLNNNSEMYTNHNIKLEQIQEQISEQEYALKNQNTNNNFFTFKNILVITYISALILLTYFSFKTDIYQIIFFIPILTFIFIFLSNYINKNFFKNKEKDDIQKITLDKIFELKNEEKKILKSMQFLLNKQNEIQKNIDLIKKSQRELEAEQNLYLTKIKNIHENIEKTKLNINHLDFEINELSILLIQYFSNYKSLLTIEEIEDSLPKIKDCLDEINTLTIKLESYMEQDIYKDLNVTKLKKKYIDLKTDLEKSNYPFLSEDEHTALKINIENSNSLLYKLREDSADLRAKIKHIYANSKNIYSIEKEIDIITEKMKEMNNYTECINIALHHIDIASEEIRKIFSPSLNKKTEKIFSQLTNYKYQNLMISPNFDINIGENTKSAIHEWQYLSKGTIDQAYFSLRFALCELLTEAPTTIFLDDILIQYDEKRAKQAIEFLKKHSQKNQIIFFTCHKHFETLLINQ